MPTETFTLPSPVALEEPRTATEAALGIGGPRPVAEAISLKELNTSYPEEQEQAVKKFESDEAGTVAEELSGASEASAALAVEVVQPGLPAETALGNMIIGIGTRINSLSSAFDGQVNARLDSVRDFAQTVKDVTKDCRDRIRQWDGAKQAIANHDPELGFGKAATVEIQPVLQEAVPVTAVELVQPPTPELQEAVPLGTPERIRQVFSVIEGMNADGGKFDAFSATLKLFQEQFTVPNVRPDHKVGEIVEAVITKIFGGNSEIAKVVMKQGIEGVLKYQQELEVLGVDASTIELAWELYLENPPAPVSQAEQTVAVQAEVSEPAAVESIQPVELSAGEQRLKRLQEIREQLQNGEGTTKSDLPLQAQGSMLASERSRLRAKLAAQPPDELGSYSWQTERIGAVTRELEATYDGTGETAARTEAALADINLKSEVLSIIAESANQAGSSGDQMRLLQSKLQELFGDSSIAEVHCDNDAEGNPLTGFDPPKMTLGVEYQKGRLVVSLRNKALADASTDSTLQTHTVYTER